MTGEPIVGRMPAKPTYLGAVASSTGQGLLTAAWIATGELPTGQRRAVQLAATAVVGAVAAVIAVRSDDTVVTWSPEEGVTARSEDGTPVPRRPGAAASAAVIALALGMPFGRRQLEKRWLARLQRQGHEHPYRGLALRIGLLTTVGALPGRLMDAHKARQQNT